MTAGLVLAAMLTGCSGTGQSDGQGTSLPEGPVLEKVDPCTLLTTGEASRFSMAAGKRKDGLGARTCRYQGDEFAVENSLVEGPGVGKLVDEQETRLPKVFDSVHPITIAGKTGQLAMGSTNCMFGVRVGQTSRVDFGVYGAIDSDPNQACEIAKKVASTGVPRLPTK